MPADRQSYYAATVPPLPEQPQLAGRVRTDVCVVGGGYTGLGAALALAERGFDVVVLEADRIGSGASGRNGGQIHSGQRRDQDTLERLMGQEAAMALWRMAEEAKRSLHALIERHGIECELKPGILIADHKRSYVAHSHAYADKLRRRYGYEQMQPLSGPELNERLGARGYFGGLLDHGGGHLHPLKLVRGMALAALRAGVRLFEHSPATAVREQGRVLVDTLKGTVDAAWLILAGDGMLAGLNARLDARVMPINNFILATEPLGERAQSLIANGEAVADSRFVVNYFRLSSDGRLLFGGGENYGRGFPKDLKAFVRRRMLTVFPQLATARIDYAWGGTLGITATRLPYVRRLRPNVLTAAGYSGQGVLLAPYFGRILADAVAGTLEGFDRLADLPVPPFPGGRMLRWPTLVAAMSYFALRDRL